MQRELKFRVWDEIGKRFFYQGMEIEIDTGEAVDECGIVYNIQIQQFTGLKDKNEKDIYEGDILKWPEGWMYKEMCGEIKWIINGFYFANKTLTNYEIAWLLKTEIKGVIIGNIFENPELLK